MEILVENLVIEMRPELPTLLMIVASLAALVFLWPRVGKGKAWVAAGLSLITAVALAHEAIFRTRAEDAFITFRYALNLATGKGIVFNPGERVEGYSNFLFLVVLAGLKRFLGADIETAARALGVAASIVAILLTYRLTLKLTDGNRHAGLLAALLVAGSGSFAAWGPSGLETPIFAMLGMLVCLSMFSERWVWMGVLIALATMTRPDGVLFLLLVALYELFAPQGTRGRLKSIRLVAVSFLMLIVPWMMWRFEYYGHLIPNTVKAKGGMDLAYQVALGMAYVFKFALANSVILFLIVGFLHGRTNTPSSPANQQRGIRALAAFLMIFVIYVILVGGDWMPAWRFLSPVVPPASALLVVALCHLRIAGTSLDARTRAAASAFAIVCGVSVTMSFSNGNMIPRVRLWHDEVEGLCEIGGWLNRTLPHDTLVAVNANGALSYYSQLPTIDLLGLTDEHIAWFGQRLREDMPGHIAHDYAYVASRRPAIIAFLGRGKGFEPAPGHLSSYTEIELRPYYELVSFRFPESKNPLGEYVNLLVLKSEAKRIAGLLAADSDVRLAEPLP